MRLAAALIPFALALPPAAADPLCAGGTVVAGGDAQDVAPVCVDALPVRTSCRVEEVEAVGTGVSATVVVCLARV
ncbi:MAG TPA: hypothetical protein VGX28_12100 [Frankiaceae bacterium]|jgi:hypothetical protein|nr:hypothetical protein [Frankiaceae bacterium]